MRPPEILGFEGRAQFQVSVLRVLEICRHSITLLDHDLETWPLETSGCDVALRAALLRGVALRILLARSDWVERNASRLRRLQREHPARIAFRQLPESLRIADSTLVGDRQHMVRRAQGRMLRGTLVIASPGETEPAADRFEAAWQEAAPCLPVTTLGLG